MNYQQFKIARIITAIFIGVTVSVAVTINNVILAFSSVLIGMLFLFLVRKKTKVVLVDERIKNISGQAARLTYSILTVVIAFLSLFFVMIGRKSVPQQASMETLGVILSYIALLSLALYSLSYKYISKKYGETDDE